MASLYSYPQRVLRVENYTLYTRDWGWVVRNTNFTFTLLERKALSAYRDPQRLVFLSQNGYLPNYAYSSECSPSQFQVPTYFFVGTKSAPVQYAFGDAWVNCSLTYNAPEVSSTRVNSAAVSLDSIANGQLNSQARNQYYSAFETLYEGRKTKNMVTKAAVDVYHSLRDIKRGNFIRAAQTLGLKSVPKGVRKNRSLKSNWLEYRYGWMPLYYTIYGEMKRQYDRMKNQEPVRSVSVTLARQLPFLVESLGDISQNIDTGQSFGGYTFTVKQSHITEVKLFKKCWFKIHNPTLAQSSELGLSNPLLVAWELVPLSFVADWFVNVSDVLGQFDAWLGKTYLTGTRSLLVETTCRRYPVVKTYPNSLSYYYHSLRLGYSTKTVKKVDRTIVPTPPSVMPEFQVSLNPKRLVDAIALLGQSFKRK